MVFTRKIPITLVLSLMTHRISPQERKERIRKAQQRKQQQEEKFRQKMAQKAAIFKKAPGKLLKIFSGLVVVISTLFLVDSFLSPTLRDYNVHSSQVEILDVYSSDGWHVPATFHHVYVTPDLSFNIYIYKREFAFIDSVGQVAIGFSPITNRPLGFYAENVQEFLGFEVNQKWFRLVPAIALLFGLIGFFLKPESNEQTLLLSYFNLIFIPCILILLVSMYLELIHPSGTHMMDHVHLPFTDTSYHLF